MTTPVVSKQIPVLYIVGAGRSGSTLLEMILGNLPDFFSVGEIRYFWEYWFDQNWICGCGEPLDACDVWQTVGANLAASGIDLAQMAEWASTYDRTRHLPRLALRDDNFWPESFVAASAELYQSIYEASGGKVIVDSSKVPSHLYLLKQIPTLDLRVLHLVRDGRAVAYSWNKRQKKELGSQNSQETMPGKSLTKAMLVWMMENKFADSAVKQMPAVAQMRYEDFVRAPADQLNQTLTDLGWPDVDLSHLRAPTFTVRPTHSVGGNPLRFSQKEVGIRADATWQQKMPKWQQRALGLCALPVLRHYNYSL